MLTRAVWEKCEAVASLRASPAKLVNVFNYNTFPENCMATWEPGEPGYQSRSMNINRWFSSSHGNSTLFASNSDRFTYKCIVLAKTPWPITTNTYIVMFNNCRFKDIRLNEQVLIDWLIEEFIRRKLQRIRYSFMTVHIRWYKVN